MILIGILGLCVVAILYVLLYLFFIRRTDRFMEKWERELKEKIEKATLEGVQSLEQAAEALKASEETMEGRAFEALEEAAEAIKASRKAMEGFAVEKGFISKPITKEGSIPEPIIEPELEPIPNPMPSYSFVGYKKRKRKEWEHWITIPQPAGSLS